MSAIYEERLDVEGYMELRKAQIVLGTWLSKELIKDDEELVEELVEAVYEDMSSSISSYADLEMRREYITRRSPISAFRPCLTISVKVLIPYVLKWKNSSMRMITTNGREK